MSTSDAAGAPATALFDARFARRLVTICGVVPAVLLAWDAYRGQLGVNHVNFAIRTTGMLGLVFLTLTLLVTPLRRLTGWNQLISVRRALGLYGFAYIAAPLRDLLPLRPRGQRGQHARGGRLACLPLVRHRRARAHDPAGDHVRPIGWSRGWAPGAGSCSTGWRTRRWPAASCTTSSWSRPTSPCRPCSRSPPAGCWRSGPRGTTSICAPRSGRRATGSRARGPRRPPPAGPGSGRASSRSGASSGRRPTS